MIDLFLYGSAATSVFASYGSFAIALVFQVKIRSIREGRMACLPHIPSIAVRRGLKNHPVNV
ncbi:hypothetical protein [Prevotella fusca]|uniref:Uncharacterized protein n=1 Tax=Prevotella fusca JCM 17724 TaxID=1236517 RepID=A0ABX7XX04_9BACT|nr:hypothetical protein [Prevotella fusca]QUB86046.1 hypothetical protein J5A51_01910 [Prevotella fusca JCM 17724]